MDLETRFNIVTAATPFLEQRMMAQTTTLVWHRNEPAPLDHGTAVLLDIDGDGVLLTAAHLLRNRNAADFQIVGSSDATNIRFAPEEGEFWGGQPEANLDVGFLRLTEEGKQRLLAFGKVFLHLEDIDVFPSRLQEDHLYMFGMPEVCHRVLPDGRHSYGSLSFPNVVDEEIDWSNGERRPLMLEIPYPEEVEVDLNGTRVNLPDPYGMSGGGLWRVRYAANGLWVPNSRLVGLMTEFDTVRRVIRVNRPEAFLNLLGNHFPTAQAYLDAQMAAIET